MDNTQPKRDTSPRLYLTLTVVVFTVLAVVFVAFPRSRYSELEKRELAEMPTFSTEKLADNTYTSELSTWFSDTEPYRDKFMAVSMTVRDAIRFDPTSNDDEQVSFHAGDATIGAEPAAAPEGEDMEEYENKITANENAKMANHGIIIVGSGPNVRALMAYGGRNGGEAYAKALNEYKEALPGVTIYSMVVPLASEYYTPDKARSATKPQLPTIQNINRHLAAGVRPVNVYSALAAHVDEPIYLRTDHHWAPLGAFYAAQALARTAGVPFRGLDAYTRKVVHGYVGTMYGYSKDISVKKAPEDFVYYEPNAVTYTTTYNNYTVSKDYRVTGEGKAYQGPFFYKHKDGSSGAYSTFMGSDYKLTKVQTGTKNGRRVLIIKDSYGNALPGYLFYSFEEVHVVDFRYFTRNIRKYVRDNKITDLVFCTNIFNAYSPSTYRKVTRFLTQGDNSVEPEPAKGPAKKETSEKKSEPKAEKKHDARSEPAKEPAKESTTEPVQEPAERPTEQI